MSAAMWAVIAKCASCSGESVLRFAQSQFARSYVEHYAGLLDGTSPLYVLPPGPESPIGMCCVCRGRIACTIVDEPKVVPPVDRSARDVIGDAVAPGVPDVAVGADGMQRGYVVLSDEERAKGFVRAVRRSYVHEKCGTTTTMGRQIAETYARDPKFYGSTYCTGCNAHFPVGESGEFVWHGTAEKVGT